MINQTAQGLASLGRNGDSMLVHMSPKEVSGLQALGQMTGHKLHTNPHTGMPEAFNFGDLFTSFLPTIVGAALSPATGGASLGLTGLAASAAPIVGGMATGALVAGAKGEDPLMGGLMGGLGGYGGSSLGSTFAKMGGAGAATPAISSGQGVQLTANNLTPMSTLDASVNNLSSTLTNPLGTGTGGAGIKLGNVGGAGTNIATNTTATSAPGINIGSNALDLAKPPTGFEALSSGMKQFGSDPFGAGFDAFKQAGGTASDILMPVGGSILAGVEPSDLYGEPYKPKEDKYDPYAQLNLSGDTGLRLVAKGGYIDGYALGGAVNTNPSVGGGLSDLYNRPEGATTQTLSNDGYGIGRLNNLASEQSRYQAQTLGYADGGNVGMNMDKLPTLNLETGQQSGGDMGGAYGGLFGAMLDSNPEFAKQLGIPENTSPQLGGLLGAMMRKNPEFAKQLGLQEGQYARGGYLNGAGDGMSDSIPATIEGKQPARLADGEFVVPADVVSHLGNGSSKAGSKRLYAMLDKVRQARTGNKKQGKEINPNKYLPA